MRVTFFIIYLSGPNGNNKCKADLFFQEKKWISSRFRISLEMFVQFREFKSQERIKNVWDFCLRAESGYAHFIKFNNSAIKLGLVRTRDTSTFVRFHSKKKRK